MLFIVVDQLYFSLIHTRFYLVCEKDSQRDVKMSWSFSVFISPLWCVAHTFPFPFNFFFWIRKYTSNTGGLWQSTHKTDSIFLPFSLIELIIYKCCFKTVVSLSIFLPFSFVSALSFKYTMYMYIEAYSIAYVHVCVCDYTQWLILSVYTSTLCYV